jgi:hypothetical protein
MGVRKGALIRISADSRTEYEKTWKQKGLISISVASDRDESACSPGEMREGELFAIAKPETLSGWKEAWTAHEHDAIGSFLGYPSCCRRAFHDRHVLRRWMDPTWPIALETISEESTSCQRVEIRGPAVTNMLWRRVGVRALPHLPCRFDCVSSADLGGLFLDLGKHSGFETEIDWLQEILSWPVEWSGLHGIAETKTPLFKVTTNTDATGEKRLVHWIGRNYPSEGAQGLGFPYRTAATPLLTESSGFTRGLQRGPGMVQIKPLGSAGDHDGEECARAGVRLQKDSCTPS